MDEACNHRQPVVFMLKEQKDLCYFIRDIIVFFSPLSPRRKAYNKMIVTHRTLVGGSTSFIYIFRFKGQGLC